MKPARSAAVTSFLPTRAMSASTSLTTAGSVTTVRTTSTRPITGAGLNQCIPTTREGREVSTASSVTDNDDVFVASTASGEQIVSSERKISRLRSSCYGTASTTNSQSATSSSLVVNVM